LDLDGGDFAMDDAFEALRMIQTLALVARENNHERLSANELAHLRYQALDGIVLMAGKALAKAPNIPINTTQASVPRTR
jgi:hypothetical protein